MVQFFTRMCVISLLALTSLSMPLAAAEISPFHAHYKVYFKGVRFGNVERKLEHLKQSQYKLISVGSVILGAAEHTNSSWFSQNGDKVEPGRYYHQGREFSKRMSASASFVGKNKVRFRENGEEVVIDFEQPTLDPGALTVLLQSDVKAGLETFNYHWAWENEVKPFTLEKVGEERIKVMGKEVDAVRLVQTDEGRRETTIWVAPELDYQIVLVRVSENGSDWGHMELVKLED